MLPLQDSLKLVDHSSNVIVSLEEARSYLATLDLGYLIETMCASHYPLPRWTSTDASYVAKVYKNFLFLQKKYFSFLLVPTREVDEFWHNHILYTKNYFRDCYHIFGHYLHHQPASPYDHFDKLIAAFERTKQLYMEEFHQPLHLICRSDGEK